MYKFSLRCKAGNEVKVRIKENIKRRTINKHCARIGKGEELIFIKRQSGFVHAEMCCNLLANHFPSPVTLFRFTNPCATSLKRRKVGLNYSPIFNDPISGISFPISWLNIAILVSEYRESEMFFASLCNAVARSISKSPFITPFAAFASIVRSCPVVCISLLSFFIYGLS